MDGARLVRTIRFITIISLLNCSGTAFGLLFVANSPYCRIQTCCCAIYAPVSMSISDYLVTVAIRTGKTGECSSVLPLLIVKMSDVRRSLEGVGDF